MTLDLEMDREIDLTSLPISLHSSFYSVQGRVQKWLKRFPLSADEGIYNDLFILYLLANKNYLDHRDSTHLFRLALALHFIQKKLLNAASLSPNSRHLELKWIPTQLIFPFSLKPALGCLIGFNVMNRYEVFDEENILLALQKHLPQLRLVREGFYCHTSKYRNLKLFYFEIEKEDSSPFSSLEGNLLRANLEEKIKNSIQTLSPTIFMRLNEEEIYKNILVLGQEIQTIQDLPQSYITLDQQTGKEIVFRVILVFMSPFHRFSLKERFFDCSFISERTLTIKHLDNHPIEAHIFRLSFPRIPSLLRSDGSLDFYSARQKVVSLIKAAIGEFRDFNGGIIIQQQEQLHLFKEAFPELANHDPELLENFFYEISPLEKQIVIQPQTLSTLFHLFLESRKERLAQGLTYTFKTHRQEKEVFLIIHAELSSLFDIVAQRLQDPSLPTQNLAYNHITTIEGAFFNATLQEKELYEAEPLIQSLREALQQWHKKIKDQQILRIAGEHPILSLDPRIGGDATSRELLKLLFEGLTRLSQKGDVENALAESIEVSSSLKEYTFRLRPTFWNDNTPVSAYDFEYAWKKVLSPTFKTSFTYLFYPIKYAKEAKEGRVSLDRIGIRVLDERTLKVELVKPTPYFLHLLAHQAYAPIHRFIDQERPQWPYQTEKNYPCNGPFQLRVNQPGQGYQLIKNPLYWDASPITFDQITFTLMAPSQALKAFQKKEIDCIGNPFGSWHPFYIAGKSDRITSTPANLVCWCTFNTSSHPLNHRKLREAFAFAIDRAEIISGAFLPLNPAYSPLLERHSSNHAFRFPEVDREKAQALFQEALDELGITREDLSPLSLTFTEKGIREHIALCLKEQLQSCFNIDCSLEALPWNIAFDRISKGNFQISIVHWSSSIDDPIDILSSFKSADEFVNLARWEHPQYKQLIKLCEEESNPFQRSNYLKKAEEFLCQEMPVIPLFYQPSQSLMRKNLHIQNPDGSFDFARGFYKKEAVL